MPLGRLAPVTLAAALAVASSTGCQAPSWTSRAPTSAEVKTRVEGERTRPTRAVAAKAVEPTSSARPRPDPLDEASPLPPAIEPPESAATPLLDEALARAELRKADLIEAMTAEDSPKPPPALALATPAPAEPAKPPETAPARPPEPPPKSPEEIWRDGIQTLRGVARDRLKSASPGGPSWAVRDRLLAWLAEPDIDPDSRGAADVARGRAVLKGLGAVIDPSAPNRAAEIREAVAALEAEAPLEIAELKPCRTVRGFGDIEPLDPAVRKAGQSVVLYSELSGLAYEPLGQAFRSRVDGKVELFRDGFATPAWTHPLGTVEDTCRKRRRDYFIGHKFTLPDDLAPGNYRLRLTQKDLVAGREATRETGVVVVK
jgi:hypothetical protein